MMEKFIFFLHKETDGDSYAVANSFKRFKDVITFVFYICSVFILRAFALTCTVFRTIA